MSPETGIFIDVEVDEKIRDDAELAKKLEEVCPVDIFIAENGKVETVPENLDAAPDGTVVVKKLYDGTELKR